MDMSHAPPGIQRWRRYAPAQVVLAAHPKTGRDKRTTGRAGELGKADGCAEAAKPRK